LYQGIWGTPYYILVYQTGAVDSGAGMNFLKIKISYKTVDILDWICTVVLIALAFWANWRVGIAFIVYDILWVCDKAKEELRAFERIERFLKNNSAHGGNDE
jgi:hypothetical protein